MAALRTRGGLLAGMLALLLVAVAGLAMAGAFSGCREQADNSGRPSQAVTAVTPGDYAWVVAKTIAETAPRRGADTWGEIHTREFLFDALQQYGYVPRSREFIAEGAFGRVHSANIVAVKPGESSQQLIIGAHYDSTGKGEGYADNASGVGLLLELAARLKKQVTPYTLVFVAFGAEERGVLGSRHYVRDMSSTEKAATLGMIDLDAVAGGDALYVTTQPGAPGWLRDDALSAARQLKVPLGSSPDHADGAAGTSTAMSDDLAFSLADIPTATFSATSWTAGDRDGRTPTRKGELWHTQRDSVAIIERSYPGRVRAQLHHLARVLEALLTSKLEKTP